MAPVSDPDTLLVVAADILGECNQLLKQLKANSITEPSLVVGASTELWSSSAVDIAQPRTRILGLIEQLARLVQGPHEFLEDYVSSNWEYGALYTVLQFNVLEQIPLDGQAQVSFLAKQSGLPENKLLRILRLLCCKQILNEVEEGVFCHTAISEELVKDEKFKAFVGFQYVLDSSRIASQAHCPVRSFETRIASAHLADSLKPKPNDYGTGQSAFKYAYVSSSLHAEIAILLIYLTGGELSSTIGTPGILKRRRALAWLCGGFPNVGGHT